MKVYFALGGTGKGGRREVNSSDLDKIAELSQYINLDCKKT